MSRQFSDYLLVSAVALVVDYASLYAFFACGLRESVAAALGYCVGAAVHYALSKRYVFARGWMHSHPFGEFGAFVASGVVGLAITASVVYVGTELAGLPLILGKTLAVAVSFFAVYLMRRAFVFRRAA